MYVLDLEILKRELFYQFYWWAGSEISYRGFQEKQQVWGQEMFKTSSKLAAKKDTKLHDSHLWAIYSR